MNRDVLVWILICLLVVQTILFICGVVQLRDGKVGVGLFNIFMNVFFGGINVINLKRVLED